tara:strand:- start:1080 stop:3608 length:2529 start_codon:yes stop_codon:yes gene_type:complete
MANKQLINELRTLANNGYCIMNVMGKETTYTDKHTGETKTKGEKCPSSYSTYGFTGWERAPHSELMTKISWDHNAYGFRVGEQENGKFVISLDFDRNDGCETCERLWNEYSGFGNNDGMFESSTTGNFNVLIEVDIPKLVEFKPAQVNVGKLQILIRGNQVVPPTMTTDKKTGLKNRPRKWLSDKRFLVLDNSNPIYIWLMDLLNPHLYPTTTIKPVKVKQTMAITISDDDEEPSNETDKWTEALLDVIGNPVDANGNYLIDGDEWKRIAGVLKSNGYEKSIWRKFNELVPNNWNDRCSVIWDTFSADRKMSVGCLVNLMKKYNMKGYIEWKNKHTPPYLITTFQLADVFAVSELIAPRLKEILVLCEEEWWCLNEKTQLWSQQKSPDYMITTEVRKYIDYSNMRNTTILSKTTDDTERAKLIAIQKEFVASYANINKTGYISMLQKYLRPQLADNKFTTKLNVNIECLAFQNGMLDLKTNTFREGLMWDDYLTENGIILYNYIPEYFGTDEHFDKYEWFCEKIKQIANNNDEHFRYYQQLFGYSFIGMPFLEKMMMFMIDKTECSKGDNGKSFLFELATDLAPCYVYKSDATLIEDGYTKTHKQIIKTHAKRLVWLDELKKKQKINARLLKILAEGSSTECEVMYGTSTHHKIYFKLFILSNHTPNIDAGEDAVFNRAKQFSFHSHFDRTGTRTEEVPELLEFIADSNLGKTMRDDYVMEFFQFIIQGAKMYYNGGITPPTKFLADIAETQQENDDCGNWLREYYVIDKNIDDKLSKDALIENCGNKWKLDDFQRALSRMGLSYNKGLRCGSKTVNGVLKGISGGWKGIRAMTEADELADE